MRTKPRSRAAFAVVVAAVMMISTACSGGSNSKSSNGASGGTTVTMHLDGPLSSYDPAKGASFQDAVAMWSMYDPLVDFDSDGKLVAGLATSWTSTPTSATFKLRDGVSCADGTKLTSQMVASSLTRYMDPKTAAPFLSLVIGGKNTAQVTAPDANTVTVTLKNPWSGLVPGLAAPYTGIICPAGLKNPGDLLTKSYGTGPYVAASQVSGASYTLTRRADYTWGPKFAKAPTTGTPPKTLVLEVVQDESTRANLMGTGKLQIATYSSDAWTRFKGQPNYNMVSQAQSDTWLMFNENKGHPTADKNVRKAVSQALNRDMINKIQSFGSGQLISNLGESTYECYDPSLDSLIPSFDTAAASATLKGVKIRIIGTNLLAGGDANGYLLSALKAAGADASVNTMNNQTWVGDLFAGKNDWDISIMVLGNTISSLLEAGGFEVGAAPPAGENLGGVQNPEAEAAFVDSGAKQGAAKCAAMSKFQKSLLMNNDVLPIATAPATTLFTGGTSGVVVKGFVQTGTIRVSK
jgi:peptide/nickel transport system substrate-binding protein